MSNSRSRLCALYVAVAGLALVATWRQNLAFMDGHASFATGFVAFWPALLANRATISITVDIFLFGLAATVWMVLEARRLAIKGVWLYVLLGFAIAISVAFPLFLVARERRLAAISPAREETTLTASDMVGLALCGLPILAFAVWCTVR